MVIFLVLTFRWVMIPKKRSKKESREYRALLGLVELYLKSGKPIGSSTLRENGFDELSTATLRNYFAELEIEGYLKQPHSSGGRIPTSKGLKFYAEDVLQNPTIDLNLEDQLQVLRQNETKNVTTYLQNAAEIVAQLSDFPTFLSSVRFDHDFILDVRFVSIDAKRVLCILITHFGQILTEDLQTEKKLSSFSLKRIENYFSWKLGNKQKQEKPSLNNEEETLAQKFYSEIMVRYLVRYSNFSDDDIYRTGFSKLLGLPEFNDPISLTTALSLFENLTQMRLLLSDCVKSNQIKFWIGEDLIPYTLNAATTCACIAIPYRIHQLPAGAIALWGPCRMPYRTLFATMQLVSTYISETLTKSLYKFKLTFRQPRSGATYPVNHEWHIDQQKARLLDIKEKK